MRDTSYFAHWAGGVLLLLLVASFGVGAQGAAGPAADERQFTVPGGPLGEVLARFADVAGVVLSFDAALTEGLRSDGLDGRYAVDQALNLLIRGHPMVAVRMAEGHYTLRPTTTTGDGVMQLAPVQVQGAVVTERDKAYQSAGSSTHLDQARIERFRGTTVGDIFQGTPGVLVGENRNSGGLDVNIRGMQGQSRVPVLVDGARQETTVYRGYAGVSSRSYVDPDLIASIDISKGPTASADGTGAVGGLVSMRTVGANDIIQDGRDWGVRLRAGAFGNSSNPPPPGTVAGLNGTGRTYRINCAVPSLCAGEHALPESFGSSEGMSRPATMDLRSWAGSIAAARRFEWFDLVAAYAQRRQGNYYSGTHGPVPDIEFTSRELPFYTEVTAVRDGIARFRGGERVVNSNNSSHSILLKGNVYLPADQLWELGYIRYESEYGELMPSQLIWLDEIKQTDNSKVVAHTYTSRYQWNPSALDWLHLRLNTWHTHANTINRAYSSDLYGGLISNEPQPERYDRWGGDLGNQMRFEQWGTHSLEYGVTAQREEIDSEIALNDDGEPLSNAAYGRVGDRQEFSLFLSWQWMPLLTLTFDAGIRYSRADTDDHKRIVPRGRQECRDYDDAGQCVESVYVESVFCVDHDGDGACDPIRYRTRNSGTAPIASLTWEPWLNGLQFYALYAQALRMPSLFEATQGWSVEPALDVPLQAERAYNVEFGSNLLRHGTLTDDDRLAVKLAWFRNRTRNYLTRTSPNVWEEGGQIFVMRNIDSVDLHGVELSVEYDTGWIYGELAGTRYHHIEVCHYGSYRRERCNDYGVANSYFNNMIPPDWHASVTIGARLFTHRLDLGVRGAFMGQRTETPPFNDDSARGFNRVVPWRPYNLLDIYASWTHSEWLSIDFNVDNLADRYYLDALSLGLVPAPGRTARLSLTLNF